MRHDSESRRVYRDLLKIIPTGEFRSVDFIGKTSASSQRMISGQLQRMEHKGLITSRKVQEKRKHGQGSKHTIKIYRRSARFPEVKA